MADRLLNEVRVLAKDREEREERVADTSLIAEFVPAASAVISGL